MKKVREMSSRDSEFQRFETLKRNREKRAKQGLFFLEGVHPVEQAVANGYEFYAIGVDAEKLLSGWAEDMLRRANPEMILLIDEEYKTLTAAALFFCSPILVPLSYPLYPNNISHLVLCLSSHKVTYILNLIFPV